MNTLLYKISFTFPIIILITSCVSSVKPQLLTQHHKKHMKKTHYSQCNLSDNASTHRSHSAQTLDPNNISLLNWNIYKGQRSDWHKDLETFIEEKDIITIQEAHLSTKLKSVLSNSNYQWTLNTAFHLNDKPAGVMTASRIPAIETCGLRHKEPLIRTHKTTLVSYYPIEGINESLLVANIHSINFTWGISAYKKQINHLFEIISEHDGPIMLAGDFNTWSDSRMTVITDLVTSAQLTSLNYATHNRTKIFGNAIDHIFFRGLEAISHHSWDVTSSDHNPTRVTFKLLQNPTPTPVNHVAIK